MKFGVREICDVVLKAKAAQKVGNRIFYKDEPVIYFDTLKTSSLEGAATTVYAQGGRGNPRLVAWEGERTVTFTMEDALISPAGLMILTGAGLISATNTTGGKLYVHTTEQIQLDSTYNSGQIIDLSEKPFDKSGETADYIYVMKLDDNGDVDSEPLIASAVTGNSSHPNGIKVQPRSRDTSQTVGSSDDYLAEGTSLGTTLAEGDIILVDYYVERDGTGGYNVDQIEITADKFGGNYYLEASTLFRDTHGIDHPAEFIIPNCKIQSNFTFSMASSGDPSTFTFTMDAFPDYTRWDKTKKVLVAIQMISEKQGANALVRENTPTGRTMSDRGELQEANG